MPSQNSLIRFSGKIKDKVYYYRKNRKNRKHYFIRPAPATVTQTTATQMAATDFGTASKSSRLIRQALHEYTPRCHDKRLHVRLAGKMVKIVRADINHTSGQRTITADNLQSLQHFRFNSAASIQTSPVIEKNDTGNISISFPHPFSHALRNTTHIAVKAIGVSVNFAKSSTRKLESNTVVIKRGGKYVPVTLTMNLNQRDVTFIILEIQSFYEVNGQLYLSQDKKNYSLDIIAVLPPVEAPKERKKYRNKAPHFWLPYIPPAIPAVIIMPVNCSSLPEG
jgi:hypothetical protein